MTQRLNPYKAAPAEIAAMRALEDHVQASGLDYSLVELVKTRASQINCCAFCLHMHTTDARKAGESEERLHLLAAWREAPVYTDRERAALGWCEALTRLSTGHPSDADYAELTRHFSEEEAVKLTLLIVAINGWNRIAVGFGAQPAVATSKAA